MCLLPHARGRDRALVALLDYLAATIERTVTPQNPAIYHTTLKLLFDACVASAGWRDDGDLLPLPLTPRQRLALGWRDDGDVLTPRQRLALKRAIAPLAQDVDDAWGALTDACGAPQRPPAFPSSDGWYDRGHVLRAIELAREAIASP